MGLFSKKLYFDGPLNLGNVRKNLERIDKRAWDNLDLHARDAFIYKLPGANELYVTQRNGLQIGFIPHDADFDRIMAQVDGGDYYAIHCAWIVYVNEKEGAIAVEVRID